jgi:hypothetical protein
MESNCTSLFRYSILSPNAIPQGFTDGKQVTEKVLLALQLDPAEYRLGTTKVFFKVGVLGMLEDMRDERLSKIISMFQAHIRGYLIRKAYKKLQDQRSLYLIIKKTVPCLSEYLLFSVSLISGQIIPIFFSRIYKCMDGKVFLLLYLQTLRDIFNPVKYVIEEKLNFIT